MEKQNLSNEESTVFRQQQATPAASFGHLKCVSFALMSLGNSLWTGGWHSTESPWLPSSPLLTG